MKEASFPAVALVISFFFMLMVLYDYCFVPKWKIMESGIIKDGYTHFKDRCFTRGELNYMLNVHKWFVVRGCDEGG